MGNAPSDIVGVTYQLVNGVSAVIGGLFEPFKKKPHETNDTMQAIQANNEKHEQERQQREAQEEERFREREASSRQREQATLDTARKIYDDAIQAREEAAISIAKQNEESARQREEANRLAVQQMEAAAQAREEAARAREEATRAREEAAISTAKQTEESARQREEAALLAVQQMEVAVQAREEAAIAVAKQIEESARQREEAALLAVKQIEAAALAREEAAQAREEATRAREEAALAEAAKAKEDLHKGIRPVVMPTPEQVAAARERMQYHPEKLHFAVCGSSGSGKSTVVNAVRGLGAKGEGTARVGVIECTSEISRYPDPRKELPYSRFIWYDIPGAGTTAVPDWQYFNDQGLFVFDFIIMVYGMRFTKIDVGIIENCLRFNIPVFIVRSKADQHIQNMIRDDSETDCEPGDEEYDQVYQEMADSYIKQTRRDFFKHMETMADNKDLDPRDQQLIQNLRVYIVSGATLRGLVQTKSSVKGKVIDETELIEDMLRVAARRRYSNMRGETKNNLFKKGKDVLSAGFSSLYLNAGIEKPEEKC